MRHRTPWATGPGFFLGVTLCLAACSGGGGGDDEQDAGGDDASVPAELTPGDLITVTGVPGIEEVRVETQTLAVIDAGQESGLASFSYPPAEGSVATLTLEVLADDQLTLDLISAQLTLRAVSGSTGTVTATLIDAGGGSSSASGGYVFVDN